MAHFQGQHDPKPAAPESALSAAQFDALVSLLTPVRELAVKQLEMLAAMETVKTPALEAPIDE